MIRDKSTQIIVEDDDPRVVSFAYDQTGYYARINEHKECQAVLGGFFRSQYNDSDFVGMGRVMEQSRIIYDFIEQNSNIQIDDIFRYIQWYIAGRSSFIQEEFVDVMYYLGLKIDRIKMDEKIVDLLLKAAEYYCKFRHLEFDPQQGPQIADATIAQLCGVRNGNLPISYEFINQNGSLNIMMPPFRVLANINKSIINGGNIYFFCCPAYAKKQRMDGTFEYTMDGISEDIGLTAERGLPVISSLIQSNPDAFKKQPINIEVGIADFEATEANAKMVGVGSIDEFEVKLGGSIRNMALTLMNSFGAEYDINVYENQDTDNIGKIGMHIMHKGQCVASIIFSSITDKFYKVDGYEGKETFESLVTTARVDLVKRANGTNEDVFKRQLDNLVQVRLNLMIKWCDITDPNVPDFIKTLYFMLAELENDEFVNVENILNKYGFEFTFEKGKNNIDDYSIKDREEVVKKIMMQSIYTSKDPRPDCINYLRTKVAAQGAEYSVMHSCISQIPNSAHFCADAMGMWQVFGQESLAVLGIKGGYEGADKIVES